MKIYETNAGLGYAQKAYLLRMGKTENGHDYLCVGYMNIHRVDMYRIGEVVSDLTDAYVEESDFDIEDSPLYNSFLFNHFLKTYKDGKLEL